MRDAFYAARSQVFSGQHQQYFLDIIAAPSSAQADVFEVSGDEAIGRPNKYTIRFTHPSHDLTPLEYIGKIGAFVMQPVPVIEFGYPKIQPGHRKYGVVTGFAQLSSSRDQSTYECILESRLALLRNTPKQRYFYDMSEPEVIETILNEHDFNHVWATYEISLHQKYRKRPFIQQPGISDLEMITYLCERTGIWFVTDEGDEREKVRICDDLTHYRRDTRNGENHPFRLPYRQQSGLNSDGRESVRTLEMRAASIPKKYHVRSYNYRLAPHVIETTVEIFGKGDDRTTSGEMSVTDLPIETKEDAEREATLRMECTRAGQIKFKGEADARDITPGTLIKFTNREVAVAKYGLFIESAKFTASRGKSYSVEFTAMPNDFERPYRMPMHEPQWPRIVGSQSAVIASTEGYSGPYIDAQGEYILLFHQDRTARQQGFSSPPMRMSKLFAGANRTGTHLPALAGTEVNVEYHGGHPDLPFIAASFHNAQHPDPVYGEHQWRTRNVLLHTVRNSTIQAEDRIGQEHLKLAVEPGKSQLNLGHAVDRGDKKRGLGYELRTDERGVVRGGAGLLFTSEKQEMASGQVVDTGAAEQVFRLTHEQAEALAQAATTAKAEVADIKAENQWLKDELADLKKQVIALSAPDGIGMATPDRVLIGAGKDITANTSRNFNVSAARNVVMQAKQALSLFAYRCGIGIRAAQGPVAIEAHSDNMALSARKDVLVSSVDGAVHVRAKQDIILESGGAFIEIKDGNVTLGGTGKLNIKFPGISMQSAAVKNLAAPAFAVSAVPIETSCEVWTRGSSRFAEETSPPVLKQVNAAHTSSQAPTPDASVNPSTGDGLDTDQNPRREPTQPVTPDGQTPALVKLKPSASCNWKLPVAERMFSGWTETGEYQWMDGNKKTATDADGNPIIAGGALPYAFKLTFAPSDRCVTASYRINVVPVDLLVVDSSGNLILKDGLPQSIPYDQSKHSNIIEYGPEKPHAGLIIKHRDDTSFDLQALKHNVEAKLNSHGGLFILDGCTRSTACGWRVAVKFRVDLVKAIKGGASTGISVDPVIYLFPKAQRASSGAWGEQVFASSDTAYGWQSALSTSVLSHECMHLCGAPDEYWEYGGFVHKQYIKNQKLDFERGAELSGQLTWQMKSVSNLMGYGSDKKSASVPPYYLEYVRRSFKELNEKRWKIGYNEGA